MGRRGEAAPFATQLSRFTVVPIDSDIRTSILVAHV